MISSADSASRGHEQLPLTIDVEVPAPRERWRRDYLVLALIATAFSVASLVHNFQSGKLLLYGDAVAHMNIARRVFDSRLPGLFQLGTVWLPLPHLLMLPFVTSTWMWQTGVGGAFPSMAAFVAGALGIFRLVHTGLTALSGSRTEARVCAWFAAVIFVLNSNLHYLLVTAMTETIYLALFIWATVFVAAFAQHLSEGKEREARRSLLLCGVMLLLAMMTRYDGWFTAVVYAVAILAMLIAAYRRSGLEWFSFLRDRQWRKATIAFVFLLAIFPCVWLAFNKHEFKDPLAFVRGPYSAKAIEARTRVPGQPHHPGWESPRVAATYFVESGKLNMAATDGLGRMWLYAALLASVMLAGFIRPLWPWLLLWTPVPFYALAIAWGGVPIFIPKWWPFSYYNVRYGTQLIPLFAVFGALLLYLFLRRFSSRLMKRLVFATAALFVLWSYYTVGAETPICVREAWVNSDDRIAIETKLASELSKLPRGSTVLIYIGQHGGALQRIGFPLNRTLNECQKRYWYSAIWYPAMATDFVVATDGDPVSRAVADRPDQLVKVADITSPRQASIRIYRSTAQR